jgi:predicted Rossmann-fold nucleotide-binding protein
MLTLQQTGKIGRIPIILLGVDFWTPMQGLIKDILVKKYEVISPEDINLYTITDNEEDILKIISESRMRDGRDALK